MAAWLDKNLGLMNIAFILVVFILMAMGIKDGVYRVILAPLIALMAIASLIASKHKKINLFGAMIWTVCLSYFVWRILK